MTTPAHLDDTIAAIATAPGGGVGVIRLSGPEARAIAAAHFAGPPPDPEPRRMYHGRHADAESISRRKGRVLLDAPAGETR